MISGGLLVSEASAIIAVSVLRKIFQCFSQVNTRLKLFISTATNLLSPCSRLDSTLLTRDLQVPRLFHHTTKIFDRKVTAQSTPTPNTLHNSPSRRCNMSTQAHETLQPYFGYSNDAMITASRPFQSQYSRTGATAFPCVCAIDVSNRKEYGDGQ